MTDLQWFVLCAVSFLVALRGMYGYPGDDRQPVWLELLPLVGMFLGGLGMVVYAGRL